ncbi:MAG: hypothetical protein QOF94_411 [Acidobacteriaceae bacterium]
MSDVMSFSPLLKRLFSLVLLLLAAVKHKRFAPDERGRTTSTSAIHQVGKGPHLVRYELPISTPVIKTRTPPRPTCNAADTVGVSM